jgi:hypothetical protein
VLREHDVGGFHVTVQEAALVGMVQGRNSVRYRDHLLDGQSSGMRFGQMTSSIGSVDELHRDPQLAGKLAAVVDADNVGMPQPRSQVGFAREPLAESGILRYADRQNLQSVAAGQSWVPGEVEPADLYEWAHHMYEQGQIATQHNLLNNTCDIDGDTAHSETYCPFAARNRDQTN